MSDINSIEIKYLRNIIPDNLFKKFVRYEITSIESVQNISIEYFRKYRSVGVIAEQQFIDFKKMIANKPEVILQIFEKNYPKFLPFEFHHELNPLELFVAMVDDFLKVMAAFPFQTQNAKNRCTRDIDIVRKHFGLKSPQYKTSSICHSHDITKERVRQIDMDFIQQISDLLNGVYLEKWKCECWPEVVKSLQSLKNDFTNLPILIDSKLSFPLKNCGIENDNETQKYLILLINAWGYRKTLLSCTRLRHHAYYVHKNSRNNLLPKVSDSILAFLERKVIPVSMNDIVDEVQKEYNVHVDVIQLLCNVINKIEKTDKALYQVKLEYLPTILGYAYRILYENKKVLTQDEIVILINKHLPINKQISKTVLRQNLRQRHGIVPVGRTGKWVLKDLKTNVETQINLILRTLKKLKKTLTTIEITKYIHENLHRKDVTLISIRANLKNYRKYFIKLKGNRYTLAENAETYKDDIVVKKVFPYKKKEVLKVDIIVSKAVEKLSQNPNNQMRLPDLVQILLKENEDFSVPKIYGAISKHPLIFKKEHISKLVKTVKLITKSANDKGKTIMMVS